MLEKLDEDNDFLREVMFSHEAILYVSEKVNKHNVHFWVSEHPPATVEHIRDSSRVVKVTVTSSNYIQYAMFFQQDGAPPYLSLTVHASLNQRFPNQWTGCAGPISWPVRSPDITPCHFFLWAYIKDFVYQIPVADINDLKNRVQIAIATADNDMLQHI
jgi:hypothetical protein